MGSTIDSNFSAINPSDFYKVEIRQSTGVNRLDLPTAGERFKMALAKIGSFFGSFGGAICNLFGPLGKAGSMALYGLQSLSDRAISNMQAKKQQEAAVDSQAASLASQNIQYFTPGYVASNASPGQGGELSPSIQWAPYSKPYEKEINNTLNSKGGATAQAINQI